MSGAGVGGGRDPRESLAVQIHSPVLGSGRAAVPGGRGGGGGSGRAPVGWTPGARGGLALVLEVLKDLREEVGVGIKPQHLGAEPLDEAQAALPEALLVGLHEEGLEWV